MKKHVTIKDIARELNIHHTTVSRALRNCKSVNSQTSELIWKKATELGYKPNLLAQGFRNSRSKIIGILVPDLQHYLFSKFISDFSNLARQSGYSVMVFQSSDKYKIEKEIVNILVNYRVAGVLCSISIESKTGEHFNLLKESDIPLVFFDRIPKDIDASCVEIDNFHAAYDAVTLLIRTGKTKIAFISTSSHINVFGDRLNGYKQALVDNNLDYNESFIIEQPGHCMNDGYSAARKLLELEEVPDAILTVSDDSAIGAIKFLKNKNIRIPQDISILGFDNGPMCIVCEPELTVVNQPIERLTIECFDLLMKQIESGNIHSERRTIKGEIIFRKSC
ncbi:MAG: LacI family DNA-binding transcriptional regulator [Bacteroides sp.]|uniref:LacI family DNA-binding transcriptional regulator n=1 Tax=Bacteroides sp. TaxID=29523 RepID=UPI002FCAB1D6